VLLAALLPLIALAQVNAAPTPTAADQVYRPMTSGPLVSYTALLTPPGRLLVQPMLGLAFGRGSYDSSGAYVPTAAGDSSLTGALSLFVEYGLSSRFATGAQVGATHARRAMSGASGASTGAVDSLLHARGVLLQETTGIVPELVLMGLVKLPTGRSESATPAALNTDVLGAGAFELVGGVSATKGLRPVLLHLDLFYARPLPSRLAGQQVLLGHVLSWSFAAELPIGNGRFALAAELSAKHQGPLTRAGQAVPDTAMHDILVNGGAQLIVNNDVQIEVGYQRTIWGQNAPALDVLLVTVVPVLL
jgi:hypothetical protein